MVTVVIEGENSLIYDTNEFLLVGMGHQKCKLQFGTVVFTDKLS
jgi:hypothetical protein